MVNCWAWEIAEALRWGLFYGPPAYMLVYMCSWLMSHDDDE